MQAKVLHATHPDMIVGLSTEKLRSYYLLTEMFVADDIRLNYSHGSYPMKPRDGLYVAMGSTEVVFESNGSFIWAMAGDNQDYKDMDPVPTPTLR